MKYCLVDTYFLNDRTKTYPLAVLADDELFGMPPTDTSTPVDLLDPSLVGYDSISDCIEIISDKLGFNPFQVYRNMYYYIPDIKDEDEEFYNFLSDLGLLAYEGVEYSGYTYVTPTTTETDTAGNVNLDATYVHGGTGYLSGCNWDPTSKALAAGDASFFTRGYLNVFQYNLNVWPESFISESKFRPETIPYATGDQQGEDWRRYCRIVIELWFDQNMGKFNCSVDLIGYDFNIYWYKQTLSTVDTGDKYNPNDPVPGGTDPNNKGGQADGIPTTPPVTIPTLDEGGMTAAGSIRVYRMNSTMIHDLFSYLHANDPGTSIVKWFQNPSQAIISLHYLPYEISIGSTTETIKVLGSDTGVTAYPAKERQTIHFGYSDFPRLSDNYMAYAPYTKVSLYLPGIGLRELNTDDIVNKRVWVVYHCDNVTGQFVAFVAVGTKSQTESQASVKYTFSGQVAAAWPISQTNWGNTYIAGATLAAGALASGVAAAGAAGAAGAGAAGEGAAASGAFMSGEANATAGMAAGKTIGTNIGSSITSLAKPTITRSGTVSGVTSLMGIKKPYFVIETPHQMSYAGFASVKGYPYGQAIKLANLKGYALIEAVHLHGVGGTASEIAEIESLLKSGVIL